MSLNIFDKMLARFTALAISILYFQVSCSQTYGSNIISNLVLNNSLGNQSQGNIIQKSLNQFAKNRVLPNNLQQTLNLQNSQNLQSQGSQGPNLHQIVNLQTLKSQQSSNLQPVSTQQPMRLQSYNHNIQQSPNVQAGNAFKSVNSQTSNAQLLNSQHSTLSIQPFSNLQQPSINLQQTSLPNQSTRQQNLYVQNQNPPLSNVQILSQFSDVSSPTSSGGQIVQSFPGTNVPSSSTVTLTSPGSPSALCINKLGVETVPVICPQSQQNVISSIPSSVPSYLNDRSQISYEMPASAIYPNFQGNQPTVLTLEAPQNQPIDFVQNSVQNSIETPNQITVIKSVQPQSLVASIGNQDQIPNTVLSPSAVPMSPLSHSSIIPTLTSVLASSLSNQASKSPNLKSLLPLIFNLIKERNNCGCNHHCRCPNNSNYVYENEGDGYRNYPQQQPYCHRQEGNSRYYNDYSKEFEDYGRYENRRNLKRYGKNKNVKPESMEISKEFDYSDEFYEDD